MNYGSENKKALNLLIISYHYLPLNVIASYRPAGFAQHLYKFGIYPTIITHRWELDENRKWIVHKRKDIVKIEKDEKHQVIRIPRYHTFRGNLYRWLEKYYLARQFIILFRWLTGNLDPGADNTDSYIAFKKFLFEHLKTHNYDLIMGIYSPHHHLKLCYEINKKFGIPYILDFRDLWDNSATSPEYNPKGKNRIYVQQIKKYWSKWLSKADFFTTLSQPWINKIQEITSTPGHVVMHGYDDDIAEIQNTEPNRDEFIILYVGSLYKNQNLEAFLKGVSLFLKNMNPREFKLVFLGSDRSNIKVNKKLLKKPYSIFHKYLNKANYIITKRVNRNDVLNFYEKASVLLMLTYSDYQGTYSGKFFEYIGTGRPILVFGETDSIISKSVRRDRLGFVCQNSDKVDSVLKRIFYSWKNRNQEFSFPDSLKKYSRIRQTEILSSLINMMIKSRK